MDPIQKLFPILEAFGEEDPSEQKTPEEIEADAIQYADEQTDRLAFFDTVSQECQRIDSILQSFQKMDDLLTHIQTYGLSRDFVAWHNRDGTLSAIFNKPIPALESFDAVGDPNSPLAIACTEDLKGAMTKVKSFIVEMYRKLTKFTTQMTKIVFNYNAHMTKRNEKAMKLLETKVNDPSKADVTFKSYPLDKIQTYREAVQNQETTCGRVQTEVINSVSKITTEEQAQGAAEQSENSIKNFSNVLEQLKNSKPKEQEDIKCGSDAISNAKNAFTESMNDIKASANFEQMLKVQSQKMMQLTKLAENASEEDKKKNDAMRKGAEKMNKLFDAQAKLIKEFQWCIASAYALGTQFGAKGTNDKNENKKEDEQKQEEQTDSRTQQDIDMDDPNGDGFFAHNVRNKALRNYLK